MHTIGRRFDVNAVAVAGLQLGQLVVVEPQRHILVLILGVALLDGGS